MLLTLWIFNIGYRVINNVQVSCELCCRRCLFCCGCGCFITDATDAAEFVPLPREFVRMRNSRPTNVLVTQLCSCASLTRSSSYVSIATIARHNNTKINSHVIHTTTAAVACGSPHLKAKSYLIRTAGAAHNIILLQYYLILCFWW